MVSSAISPVAASPGESSAVSLAVSTVVSPDLSFAVSPAENPSVSPDMSPAVSPDVNPSVSLAVRSVVSPDVSAAGPATYLAVTPAASLVCQSCCTSCYVV